MNIINFLSHLAETLPTTEKTYDDTKFNFQNLIETNNSELLKSFISDKKFYANEDKVTIF